MPSADREKILAEMQTWLAERQHAISLLCSVDSEVIEAAIECFEQPAGAGLFLTSPARALGYRIPVEVARTPAGKHEVISLIRAIDHGVYL